MPKDNDAPWMVTPPTKPGFYWFCGDLFHGGMGSDFWDDQPPLEPKIDLVEVFKISNGVMAKACGQMIPLRKFDRVKRITGPRGYWKPMTLPEPPEDIADLFAAGPNYKPPTE